MSRPLRELALASSLVVLVAFVLHRLPSAPQTAVVVGPPVPPPGGPVTRTAPRPPGALHHPPGSDPILEQELSTRTLMDVRELDGALSEPLDAGDLARVNDGLLEIAAEAVAAGDERKLGRALSWLGQLAVAEQDFDAAEVYLLESLEVYERLGEVVGVAGVRMELGRMHVRLRERARTAGDAYDRVLLARSQLSRGQHEDAESNLRIAIEENLSTQRFGAAADAYRTLVRLHEEVGRRDESEDAAAQAARLFAGSGRMDDARTVLAGLEAAGVGELRLLDLEDEIVAHFDEYRASVEQIGRAEDYRRLYRHYRSRGDTERAWSLRLKAGTALRNVSTRAMYRRMPDVLALLYASNADISRAAEYLDLASDTFGVVGREDLAAEAADLRARVY